ncbi:MAG: 30S ribosomal protein S20 [Cyanobacteria bacterium HKST-UBA06]|nr:30S ribosomal protein S20 [Cyanobacteria bacterium HKST-UBA05]MCA9799632.1 30S ribosomal protein S20 [Cyanobacteria bacterium HKST-UBA04]MCA9806531.1 30S ribosomal protein S20 [Cyanobacteria bacterium HKST-UBA06]MCA9842611.1 30S ribosomal protein S20 [Cyanobacteria bacterium HKST-UBA03]
MANIKSAKKRIEVAERNRKRNVFFKSSVRTAIRRVNEALVAYDENKDADAVKAALSKVFSLIDRCVLKGIYHKNTAARYKSRANQRVKLRLTAS